MYELETVDNIHASVFALFDCNVPIKCQRISAGSCFQSFIEKKRLNDFERLVLVLLTIRAFSSNSCT